jgi:hypothetical protein
LEQARGVLQPMALNHKFGAPYWLYLEALLDWQQTQGGRDTAAMAALEVIGDSHCLSAAGLTAVHRGRRRRCRPHWIPGCKQWHLGNPQPNKYKHQLGRILQHLAPGSQVLLLIGEIDCRHDDGISRVLANHPERHADALIDDTVAGYLRHLIAAAAPYRHQLIIGGVPCDNLPPDLLPPAARQQHDRLIGAFNARLASRVQDAGLDFLDLQAATAASGGARHIDHFHLRPDALADALAQHYRPGAVSR